LPGRLPVATQNGRRQQEVADVADGSRSRMWSRRSPAAPHEDVHHLIIHASETPVLRHTELLTATLLPRSRPRRSFCAARPHRPRGPLWLGRPVQRAQGGRRGCSSERVLPVGRRRGNGGVGWRKMATGGCGVRGTRCGELNSCSFERNRMRRRRRRLSKVLRGFNASRSVQFFVPWLGGIRFHQLDL
jgi:hypothetical protein